MAKKALPQRPPSGLLYAILFSVFWALQIFIDKFALKYGGARDPLAYNFQTFFLSGIVASIYFFWIRKGKIRFSKKSALDYSGIALLVSVAAIVAILGLKLSTSINYGFIIKSTVIFVPIFAVLFLRERISAPERALIAVFLFGIYLLSTGGKGFVPAPGDLLILVAAIIYSITSVFQKSLGKRYSAEEITWVRNVFPIPIVFLIPAAFSGLSTVLSIEPPFFLILSAISGFLCVLFLSIALQETKATYVSMISMAVPVISTLLGYLFLGESFTFVSWLGAGIILVAGAVLVFSHK